MNRHAVITAVAAAVIAAPFAYGALSIYGAGQLEYRWHGPGAFSFFAMSNHGELEFCNTVPFWTSHARHEISAHYAGNHLGTFVTGPLTSGPLESSVQPGRFAAESLSESQHVFMSMDFELDGGDIRLDPGRFAVVTRAEAPILGLVPYSVVERHDILSFDSMMNAGDLACG